MQMPIAFGLTSWTSLLLEVCDIVDVVVRPAWQKIVLLIAELHEVENSCGTIDYRLLAKWRLFNMSRLCMKSWKSGVWKQLTVQFGEVIIHVNLAYKTRILTSKTKTSLRHLVFVRGGIKTVSDFPETEMRSRSFKISLVTILIPRLRDQNLFRGRGLR